MASAEAVRCLEEELRRLTVKMAGYEDALRQLHAEREALLRVRDRWAAEAASAGFAEVSVEASAPPPKVEESPRKAIRRRSPRPSGTLREGIVTVLAGQVLSVEELRNALRRAGYSFTMGSLSSALYALTRMGRIERAPDLTKGHYRRPVAAPYGPDSVVLTVLAEAAGPLSAPEILALAASKEHPLSPAELLSFLNALENDGQVTSTEQVRAEGDKRPRTVYSRAQRAGDTTSGSDSSLREVVDGGRALA